MAEQCCAKRCVTLAVPVQLTKLKLVKRSKKEVKAVGTDGQLHMAKAYVLSRSVRLALKVSPPHAPPAAYAAHAAPRSTTARTRAAHRSTPTPWSNP